MIEKRNIAITPDDTKQADFDPDMPKPVDDSSFIDQTEKLKLNFKVREKVKAKTLTPENN